MLVAVVGMAATARLALAPRDPNAAVAVVFAPWVSSGVAIASTADAGGRVLAMGRWSWVVIASPDGAGYPQRAAAHSAWLVADAATLFGCLRGAPK